MEPETFDTFETPTASNSIEIPSSLQVNKFCDVRSKEVEIMRMHLSKSGSNTKLAFQRLPIHMRRRCMSHNAKRLPRRLREIHLNQMKKSGLPPKLKRPSRKYRRKPCNLLQEYLRRSSKVRWLNTHIWHAKRFHMITKWGYKIPHRPCDKAFTACYRASKKFCLIQDISYFQAIEIAGQKNLIIEGFKKISNTSSGLSIGSKAFISGLREGEITLYKYNHNRAIGPVEFLWKQSSNEETCLWLWIHCAFYSEVLETLSNCFQLKENNAEYCNVNSSIRLVELKNDLSRFRLSGSSTEAILHKCFTTYSETKAEPHWLASFREDIKSQNAYFCSLNKNSVSPRIVLPITVHDPRFHSPKRTNFQELQSSFYNPSTGSEICSIQSTLSPLWDRKLRENINSTRPTHSEVAKIRGNLLVPDENTIKLGSPVPLILVQRPGNRSDILGYSDGWDLILPSSWAQSVWVSLIMCGARAGGLREFQSINFEMEKPDILHPDTCSGEKEEHDLTNECLEKYFRRPPNKRINFNKFKIASPFQFKWRNLIENWTNCSVDSYNIIRNRELLIDLQESVETGKFPENIPVLENCLIPVKIECKKGVPKRFAIICIPEKEDLKTPPHELKCEDPNQAKRKKMRDQHKILLKRLRQRRKASKQFVNKPSEPIDKDQLKEYSLMMRKLWIPEVNEIRTSCSREVIGFVKEGAFSFTLGRSKGIGYIAAASFEHFINANSHQQISFRNTNSRYYHCAKLSVITDFK